MTSKTAIAAIAATLAMCLPARADLISITFDENGHCTTDTGSCVGLHRTPTGRLGDRPVLMYTLPNLVFSGQLIVDSPDHQGISSVLNR